jgi:hypothetical protein
MMRWKQEHLLSFLLRVTLLVLLPVATTTITTTVHEFAHEATCRKKQFSKNPPRGTGRDGIRIAIGRT